MTSKSQKFIITCEHGGNEVPTQYAHLFKNNREILQSHRAYDPGALELAKAISHKLHCPLFTSTTTRLLVELNRSLSSRSLFSNFTKDLPPQDKEKILENFYYPYRCQVEQEIKNYITKNYQVIHLSIHTFTPILNKQIRQTDLGLLFDPKRQNEKKFCQKWQSLLGEKWRVRLNYPYKGVADGFTTFLRSKFAPNSYLGIELEVNQKYPLTLKSEWNAMINLISTSIRNNGKLL